MNRPFLYPVLAALVSMTVGVQCQPQKPLDEKVITTLHAAPPGSPAEMATAAAAVLVGRLADKTTIERVFSGSLVLQTRYEFDIEEVIKGPVGLQPGSRVPVFVAGGEKEFPSHIYRETIADTHPLVLGDRYVVFMAQNDDGSLRPAWGVASLYDISAGAVRAVARTFPAQDGKAVESFLTQLRGAM